MKAPLNQARHLLIGAGLVALVCAVAAQQAWNPPAPGKKWKVAEVNTGSYGTDVEYEVTRSDATWNGSPAVLFTKSNGIKIYTTPEAGRYYAVVGSNDEPISSFDPPIGFDMPLRVGETFTRTYKITTGKDGYTSLFPYTCTVAAIEKVTVRAGTFDAHRVECRSGGSVDTYWNSAELGLHVKTDLTRVMPQGRQQAELIEAPH